MSIKNETAEEIYKRGLASIRDFCRDREFNIYCAQVLHSAEYYLKKGERANKLEPTKHSLRKLDI